MAETKNNQINTKSTINQKSSFIFLISSTSFFLSIAFFIANIEKFELLFSFITIILITFSSYSFSIILVSLLIKHETADEVDWKKQMHLSNLIYLSKILDNRKFLYQIEKLEMEIKNKGIELDIKPNFDKVDALQVQSFKLKLAEGLYEHSLKKRILRIIIYYL